MEQINEAQRAIDKKRHEIIWVRKTQGMSSELWVGDNGFLYRENELIMDDDTINVLEGMSAAVSRKESGKMLNDLINSQSEQNKSDQKIYSSDMMSVTLTSHGAEIVNEMIKERRSRFPDENGAYQRAEFRAGDTFRASVIDLFWMFGGDRHLGEFPISSMETV